MRILHASDLHGNLDTIPQRDDIDLFVLSGDIAPNRGRDDNGIIDADQEVRIQRRWWNFQKDRCKRIFGNCPVVCVDGNHDFVSVAKSLHGLGVDSYEVTPQGVTVQGVRFAGFPHIPYIKGGWNYEIQGADFRPLVETTFDVGNPEILVTHSPPAGILSSGDGYYGGIDCLTSRLTYVPHRVVYHLFGHNHPRGGNMETVDFGDIMTTFVNAAKTYAVIDF